METTKLLAPYEAEMIEIRRHIHAHPELSNEEFKTTDERQIQKCAGPKTDTPNTPATPFFQATLNCIKERVLISKNFSPASFR